MASLGHNELITSSGISNAENLVWSEYELLIQALHAKHIATFSISKFYFTPKNARMTDMTFTCKVLTYYYCVYYMQSLHMKCAVKVTNRLIKITFSLTNTSQWAATYQGATWSANDIHLHKPYREGIKLPVRRCWKFISYFLHYMCPGTAKCLTLSFGMQNALSELMNISDSHYNKTVNVAFDGIRILIDAWNRKISKCGNRRISKVHPRHSHAKYYSQNRRTF